MTAITGPDARPVAAPASTARLARLVGVRAEDAAWVAPATFGVLGLAAALYLVNLTVSGYANTYYAAAAVAGSQSWSAWFFGSIDAANFITIDKPPLATMLLGLSVRLFGLSSWSILLPQALAGVATVGLVIAATRRSFGSIAAIIAGLVCALTPAAMLIFRYDNPDALLTLLLVAAAYALLRSLDAGRLRWVVLAASFVGFAFLTKYLQAYLVLPTFALVWLVAAPVSLRRRVGGLLAALGTVVVASGWWVAIVEAIPAVSRPFIGGSETNSVVDLLLGYDGLGRIFGQGGGPGGGAGGGGGFSGDPELLRLFDAEFGGQVSWLLPVAAGAAVLGLWVRRHRPRTDLARAGYLLWGGWLATHVVVFSFMSGIIHTYYAVVMAPAIGALVGAGLVELWRIRARSTWGGIALAAVVAGSAVWAFALLARSPGFAPGLGIAILAVGAIVAVIVAVPVRHVPLRTGAVAVTLAVAVLLAGPAAYAIDTMSTAYAGGDPAAGPAVEGAGGFGRGGADGAGGSAGAVPGGFAAGPGSGTQIDDTLSTYLAEHQGDATWIVAVSGANDAGSIEIATGLPVMAMGGFNGGDPAPTLEQLQAYVASGQLRYVLVGGRGGPGGGGGGPGGGTSSAITDWVRSNGVVVDEVGNGSLYDLSDLTADGV